jgi:hypothetical protein
MKTRISVSHKPNAKLKNSKIGTQAYIVALEKENVRLQKEIVALKVENFSLSNNVKSLKSELKKHSKEEEETNGTSEIDLSKAPDDLRKRFTEVWIEIRPYIHNEKSSKKE